MAEKMRAVVCDRYGSDDLRLEEVEKPEPADDEVLVKVHTASLNRLDWYGVVGRPWVGRFSMGWLKPKDNRVGVDFAGTVDAVGEDVTAFQPGDEVFGGGNGAFGEYIAVREEGAIARKPPGVSFEQAATLAAAGLTALQSLRDHGQLKPGKRVLVNGASGAVGPFAVQIAKALGAEVTAVCSTRNVEAARSIGADQVIDYTREDFTRTGRRYDLVLDIAGNRSWSAYKRVLEPQGTLVVVGGPMGRLLGPLGHIGRMLLASRLFSPQKAVFFIAKLNQADLVTLAELLEAGKVQPLIEQRYELSKTAEAIRYMGTGHARAKLVIEVAA